MQIRSKSVCAQLLNNLNHKKSAFVEYCQFRRQLPRHRVFKFHFGGKLEGQSCRSKIIVADKLG